MFAGSGWIDAVKRLRELIEGLATQRIIGNPDIEVGDIISDSRKAVNASLFVCIKGGKVDGHQFAQDAVRRGASAVVCERELDTDRPITQVVVDGTRKSLAHLAARFFDEPSRDLKVVGITGTNGKTTTVHYIRSIIEEWGEPVGTMGTLGHWLGDGVKKDFFTTPEAPDLHRYMRTMLDRGLRFCVMEVSSHAIALSRVDHVSFDVVAFTNLTRDHLDFHGDFEDYRRVKLKLFGIGDEGCFFGRDRVAAVNLGDDTGAEIVKSSPLTCLTYSLGGSGDVKGEILDSGWEGSRLRVTYEGQKQVATTLLPGRMNAENALAAYAVSLLLGIDPEAVVRGIGKLDRVEGRMQTIAASDRLAVVDYAHTPDALRGLLEDIRQICKCRIICVFGCGGDRDRGKRPEMAAISGTLADVTIVTSDNPRTEDPDKIIAEIVDGLPERATYEVVSDRGEAIQRAVEISDAGDVIVIAGKGHEDYQIVGTQRVGFDDRKMVRKALGVKANASA
jgi:UDP-N-acetylmuramoyl-L-alanyl-D-glutamate--2,6-diaminopimelate ligase